MDAHSVMHESLLLVPSRATPALARHFVEEALVSWGVAEEFADVALVTSELVTNAVMHAVGDVVISVDLTFDRVRIEVSDHSLAQPVTRDIDTASSGGWGMHIVDRLATQWGLDPRPDGKTVWCEVAKSAA